MLRPSASLARQTVVGIMNRFRLAAANQIDNHLSAGDMKERVGRYHDGLAGTPQRPGLRTLDDIQEAFAIACIAAGSQEDIIFVAAADGILSVASRDCL